MRPTSLNKDRLDEQLREHRVLIADIESHRPSFESINEAAASLIANPDNARVARKIEAKMKDLNTRFTVLQDKAYKRGQTLDEIAISLDSFLNAVTPFDEWYLQVVEVVDSADNMEADQLGSKFEDIARQRDERRDAFDAMIQTGKNLVVKKDIADATPIRDKIKSKGKIKALFYSFVSSNNYFCTDRFGASVEGTERSHRSESQGWQGPSGSAPHL